MIRALIVMDVPFYRDGLRDLLAKGGEVAVVGVASRAGEAERIAREELPDVALLDAGTAEAAEILTRLRTLVPAPKIVALAVSETPESVLKWVESGIAAYVPRDASLGELLRVLRGAARGELYCSPQVAAAMLRRVASLAAAPHRAPTSVNHLSVRERQVLALIARGLSNKAIASELGIASATAKNHVHNILDKLSLRRRVEVAPLLDRARPQA